MGLPVEIVRSYDIDDFVYRFRIYQKPA